MFLDRVLLEAARSGQGCPLALVLILIFLARGNACILLLRFGSFTGWMLLRFGGISVLLAWWPASRCVELLVLQFKFLLGLFCCHFGLFKGLVSLGGWYCLLVERIHKLEIVQMINVAWQLIRATVVLHASDYWFCSRVIFIRKASPKYNNWIDYYVQLYRGGLYWGDIVTVLKKTLFFYYSRSMNL